MIQRFSGRPEPEAAGPVDENEAADVFRRFFHALARLGPWLKPQEPAPEQKAERRTAPPPRPPEQRR